jgi:hypothetical protein
VIPCAAFLTAQYLAFGQFRPVYEEFGTKSYEYHGSYWTTPLQMDWFNKEPEPYGIYLLHMTLGHHGVFSLTPIFLFSAYGALRILFECSSRSRVLAWLATVLAIALLAFTIWDPKALQTYTGKIEEGSATRGLHWLVWLSPLVLFAIYAMLRLLFARGGRLRAMAGLTIFLTVAMLAFYTWNPKARNYGGSTQGLRWLFWLIPFWLVLLPPGVEAGEWRRGVRWLALAALAVSACSVGYALLSPWSHPWVLDALEHLNVYTLKR